MQLTEIRSQLEDLTAPGASPNPSAVVRLRASWEAIRGAVPADYHPIIDDRLALLERNYPPQRWPDNLSKGHFDYEP